MNYKKIRKKRCGSQVHVASICNVFMLCGSLPFAHLILFLNFAPSASFVTQDSSSKLLILVGTQKGTCLNFARKLASRAKVAGYEPVVTNMKDYEVLRVVYLASSICVSSFLA